MSAIRQQKGGIIPSQQYRMHLTGGLSSFSAFFASFFALFSVSAFFLSLLAFFPSFERSFGSSLLNASWHGQNSAGKVYLPSPMHAYSSLQQ